MAGNEVSSAHTHTSAVLVTRRTRLKGIVATYESGATGNVILYDNPSAASGKVLIEFDETSQGTVDIIIPGDGILAKQGVYANLPSNTKITIFYQ